MNFLTDRVRFGIDVRKKLTGADIYVRGFQIASMLPVIYLFTASGYMKILTKQGVLSLLFDLGAAVLPRGETLLLSSLYRATSSEMVMIFTMLGISLVFGLLSNIIFRENEARGIRARKVFIVLIAADLLVRLIPMKFNLAFGWPMAIIGFLVRAGFIALLIMDIRAAGNDKQEVKK